MKLGSERRFLEGHRRSDYSETKDNRMQLAQCEFIFEKQSCVLVYQNVGHNSNYERSEVCHTKHKVVL